MTVVVWKLFVERVTCSRYAPCAVCYAYCWIKRVRYGKKYKELDIWQKAIELVKLIYQKTKVFPDEEKYGLITQLRRAVVSVPSNIAEGSRRDSSKEFKYFLSVALGSLAEIETQIIVSKELEYLNKEEEAILLEKIDHIMRMTYKLKKVVE